MNEPAAQLIFSFVKQFHSVSILLCMMLLDFFMGVTVAFYAKKLSSSASYKGMLKKVGMLIIVMASGLVDLASGLVNPASGENFFVTAKMVAIAFCGTEMWSILENFARLGVKLPAGLVEALVKLQPSKGEDLPPPTQTINDNRTIVQHASNVNLPVQTDSTGNSGIHVDGKSS